MATASFAGTTFWNDASTGRGNFISVATAASPRYDIRGLPQSPGLVANKIGTTPPRVMIVCIYHLTDSQIADLRSQMATLAASPAATLTVPPGTNTQYCIMAEPPTITRGKAQKSGNGTITYEVQLQAIFQAIR